MTNSIVFFTTQTSATGSIWRILMTFNEHSAIQGQKKRNIRHLGHEVFTGQLPQDFNWRQLDPMRTLIHHNVIHLTEGELDPKDMHFIVNFRDPRDVMCNQYYWQDYHRNFGETDDEFAARLKTIHDKGLDKWIMDRIPPNPKNPGYYYNKFLTAVERIPAAQRTVATYARLCLDFDSFVEKTAAAFKVEITPELLQALLPERPEKLNTNSEWIGARWVGSDTQPGRFRNELRPETVERITSSHDPILRKMAELDPDYAALYLAGLT